MPLLDDRIGVVASRARVRILSHRDMMAADMTVDRRQFIERAGSLVGSLVGVSIQPAELSRLVSVQRSPDSPGAENGEWLSLNDAQLFAPSELSPREQVTLKVLAEEIEKRTQLRLRMVNSNASRVAPVVVVGLATALRRMQGPLAVPKVPEIRQAEGFAVGVVQGEGAPVVYVAGADERGVLFGVGKLLRSLRMTKLHVDVRRDLEIASSPQYRLRGHQLGYRPKTNSYDGWTVPMWDQYIRELALFGSNFVELIPPRSDDDPDSPHFTLPPKAMMVEMSKICDTYGLDVWIWFPAMERDYSDSATVRRELAAWGDVFKALPRVDAVFVPGGDPGHTQPRYLMALLEKQRENLRQYHPRGQMWVSPQSFSQAWLDEFVAILKSEPAWLDGVVFGPQTRVDLPTLRKLVPERYPLRLYPDITHTMECQFPVPDWDVALALTEGREPVCPRPEAFANIARRYLPYSTGFGTYSEGCNDDVNKFIWSAIAWNPDAKVMDALHDYCRFFIGPRLADDFAHGLLDLERAWQGPLISNETVDSTLSRFQMLESSASPAELLNWRFQQGLYRAYYDAYVRRRLIYETDLYDRALDELDWIHAVGSQSAGQADGRSDFAPTNGLDLSALIAQVQAILAKAFTHPVAREEYTRILQLAEALFQSVRMQLSVERYQAEAVDRGGSLDTVDAPLTNGPSLAQSLRGILALPSARNQIQALEAILDRTNPGPGGYYDALGDTARPTHLVRGLGSREDPELRRSVLIGHDYPLPGETPLEWKRWAETLFDAPLRVRYESLDAFSRYKVRVVYAGDEPDVKIRLTCEGGAEIHPLITKPQPPAALEFDIPPEATKTGELTLIWTREPGLGGNGRGVQVAEVWLIKQ